MRILFALTVMLFMGCKISHSIPADNSLPTDTLQLSGKIAVEEDGLASVRSICFLQNGDLAVLDNITRVIHFYRNGLHVHEFSSIGNGPMEYTAPSEVSFRNGGGFFLNCPSDRKILIYNEDYQCINSINFTNCNLRPGTPVRVKDLPGNLIIGQNYFCNSMADCGTEVAIWDISAPDSPCKQNTLRIRTAHQFHPIEYIMNTAMSFDVQNTSGKICIADISTDSYEINFLTSSDSLIYTYTDNYQSAVQKTDDELEAETTRIRESWIRGTGSDAGFQYEPNPENFIVLNLDFSADGTLWVRKNSPFSMTFDVLNNQYEKIAEYEIMLPDSQINDGWLVTVGDSMIAAAPVNPAFEQVIYTMSIF